MTNLNFINGSIIYKDIPKDSPFPISFLNNCEKQIEETCNFLQSNEKLLLINGFKGCGKHIFIDFMISGLDSDVLTIKYNCFETTILDDMLLSFFETFRKYVIKGKITPPRQKTENFTQKINTYFGTIQKPILVILSSFDTILKNNKGEILSFIQHLQKYPNIKIILTARTFNYDDFENTNYARTTILALTKNNFERLLKDNDIKNIGVLSNELYKQTHGYFNYINLSIKIMQIRQLNIAKFLELFSKSLLPFDDFILREALSLVDPVSLHLFRLLAIMRIPIHLNLLKSLHLYDEQRIYFFVNIPLLSVEGECLYLKDYYREIIEHQIQDNVMLKLHKACIELYETQLPLKPLERDLRLSRQTMRNEIEYHSLFLPKKPEKTYQPLLVQLDNTINIEAVGPKHVTNMQSTSEKNTSNNSESKNEKIEKINFIIEDEAILDGIAESINTFITEKAETNELAIESNKMSLSEILNNAKADETNYNYKNAIILYQTALAKVDDDNYDKFLPTIYIRLAKVYKNMSKWYEALEYYTKAQDYYSNVANTEKIAEIKLEIANIYFIIYKHENAKYILRDLEKNTNLPDELKIKINLLQAKLSTNLNEEYAYYNKSIPLITVSTDKSIIAELYYRYASINDEKDNRKTALEYYKKCAEIKTNNNYLSRAYSSLAELCDEAGKTELAIKYYIQSLEIDSSSKSKNYNGMYTNAHSLAEIYSSKDENKSLHYLNLAKKYAKELNEPYYMIDISMEIGNYYLLRKDFQKTLSSYEEAYNIAKRSFSKDNTDKIKNKIDYVKNLIKKGS